MAVLPLTSVLDRRAALGTVALLIVLGGLQLLPAGEATQRASDLLQLLLAVAATLSAVVAARRGVGKARLFWAMVAASAASWSAGQLLFTLERSALSPAYPSALQRGLFVLAAFPLAVAGLSRPDRPGASRVVIVLDVALLAGLVLFVYFYVGAAFGADEGGFESWRQVATLGQTVVVAATLAPLALLSSTTWAPTYRYIGAAGLLWFAGNAVLAAAFFLDVYRAGIWDIPWSLPFVWMTAAATTWRPTAPTGQPLDVAEPWRDTRRALALALGTVGLVPTLHMITSLAWPMDLALWHTRTRMALVALIALGALFALRQFLVVRGAEAAERARTQELERIDARFHRAFSHSPAAMAIVRIDQMRVVDANARFCELLDLPRPAILGATTADLLIRKADAGHEALEDVMRSGTSRGLPVRFHTRAGTPVETLAAIERIEVAGAPAALLLMEDLRQRRGLEDQLVNAHKMDAIGRLAGGIAHEFNNLLTAIMNAGSLALTDIDRPAVVEGHLDRIDSASQRAALLTRQLLAFGRRQALRPEVLDVSGVIEEMRSLLPSVLGEDVRLDVHAPADLPRVRADRAQLRQVVLNLAANARDAMPRGGRLSIALAEVASASGPGSDVELSVRDEGVGMTEQVQQHLFEPFFTTKERGERGGLGLAAVYGIVAQSGGRILVDSAPGRGTVVRVLLPSVTAGEAG